MLKREEITNGQFVILGNQIGIIQNVQNARENRKVPIRGDQNEIAFEILFIETKTNQQFCDSSTIMEQIELVNPTKVETMLERRINENNTQIIKLKEANLKLKEAYEYLFEKAPFN